MKDLGKTFESSYTRVFCIMCITYVAIFAYMILVHDPNPALSAIVPAIGFNLSTWSLEVIKKIWIKYHDQVRKEIINDRTKVEDKDNNVDEMV